MITCNSGITRGYCLMFHLNLKNLATQCVPNNTPLFCMVLNIIESKIIYWLERIKKNMQV